MNLISPRFKDNEYLRQVASNDKVLKIGNVGNSVNLVQQALIDLGYGLSDSDRIFGKNTEDAVRAFQIKFNLKKRDGIVGIETITKLDSLFPNYEYCVDLNFISINLTTVPFNKVLNSTMKVYAQYGIRIDMKSGKSLQLDAQEMKKFHTIDAKCEWNITSGEISELHSLTGSRSPNDIFIFFVRKFAENGLLGCGGHSVGQPACTVAANASQWDTAHEIGHVLLTSGFAPVHHGNPENLMFEYSRINSRTPVLFKSQLTQMKKSPCCTKI